MLVDQLPLLTDPNGDDEIPIERGTSLYKVKVRKLMENNQIDIDPDLDEESRNAIMNGPVAKHLYVIEKTISEIPPYEPVLKTDEMTQEVGRDAKGKLFTAKLSQTQVKRAVEEWLETHTISGVMFTVSGKRLILTPMD